MIGQPSYPQTRRKYRKRRPVGGSVQEQTHTRIWRDYIEGLLSWDDRCRLGKLYGSGTIKRRDKHD
jgi:hypothetical protein